MGRVFDISGKKTVQNPSSLPMMLLTLLAGLFCWWLEYSVSANYPLHTTSSTPLWNRMTGLLSDKWSVYLAGALLLCGMAVIVQYTNYYLILFREKTKLPFLLFLLLNSANFGFVPLRPISVAFFFLALCMVELFKAYQKEKTGMTPGSAYKATFWLGVGSLIWIHLLWLIPLFWYGMYQFRLLNFRTFMASLLGVITMYWIVAGWYVWKYDFTGLTDTFRPLTDFDFVPLREYLNLTQLAPLATAFLYTVIPGFILRFHNINAGLRTRRFISFLLASTRYLLLFLFLFDAEAADFLCIFFIPVSLLMTYLFFNTSRNVSLYYYLLLACSLILQVVHYV
ncbi:MAG: hypothetical protein LBB90_03450 [Tannerella sp.]|jgi:hypothetical protein|nr:hypothetical protein [Tannerella sp.]